jgi:hypothetical protein
LDVVAFTVVIFSWTLVMVLAAKVRARGLPSLGRVPVAKVVPSLKRRVAAVI